ncbi:Os04g0112533, partial [Oryza sativa Japonica Group]
YCLGRYNCSPNTYVKRTSTTAASRMGTDLVIMLINNVVPLCSGSLFKSSRRRQTYTEQGDCNIYRGAGKYLR